MIIHRNVAPWLTLEQRNELAAAWRLMRKEGLVTKARVRYSIRQELKTNLEKQLTAWAFSVADNVFVKHADESPYSVIPEFAVAAVVKDHSVANGADIACGLLRGVLQDHFDNGSGPLYWRVQPTISTWSMKHQALDGSDLIAVKAYARVYRGGAPIEGNTSLLAALVPFVRPTLDEPEAKRA